MLITNLNELRYYIHEAIEAGTVAIDTETISLEDRTMVGFSFAYSSREAYYVPLCHSNITQNIKDEDIRVELQNLILNAGLIVMHNSSFDIPVLTSWGVRVPSSVKINDTLILAHLYNPHIRHGLKSLAKRYLHYTMTEYKDICGRGKKAIPFTAADPDIVDKYASDDARCTWRLHKLLWDKVAQDKDLLSVYKTIEQPLLHVVADMHINGITVDSNKVAEIRQKCEAHVQLCERKLKALAPGVNLNSPKQLVKLFITDGGMPIIKCSQRTGAPSVDREVLEHYAETNATAKVLLEYRKYNKILTTFIPALTPTKGDKIYASFRQCGTISGRFSSAKPNCVSIDTEILTPKGWKKHHEINIGDLVYQWDNGTVELTKVRKKYYGVQKGIRFSNQHIDICASTNHRQLFQDRKTGEFKIRTMRNFLKDAKILHGGKLETGRYNKWLMRFNVAVQADGHINIHYIDFSFTKKRKAERLLKILNILDINFVNASNETRYRYYVYGKDLLYYLNDDKTFNTDCIELGKDFIEELFYWDGSYTRRSNYASKEEHNVDIIQAAAALTGEYRTHKRIYINNSGSISYQVDITRRNYSLTSSNAEKSSGKSTRIGALNVWAINVPSSFIICRRNGKVFVTGNCQNIPRDNDELDIRAAICAAPGMIFCGADYSQMELRILAEVSQDSNLIKAYREGSDIHQITANACGITRQDAKVVNFGVVYGMGANALAKNISVTKNEAEVYLERFHSTYSRVKLFWESTEESIDCNGYVKTLFGRRRPLSPDFARKEKFEQGGEYRSMINTIIQGTCGEITKYAMVLLYPRLKAINGRIVSNVHDEIIIEVPESKSEIGLTMLKDCMVAAATKVIKSVPIEVDGAIGKTWQEVH